MQEVIKRFNTGWVLMDSWTTQDGHTIYMFERGAKAKCSFDIEPDGHGKMYTSSGEKRV